MLAVLTIIEVTDVIFAVPVRWYANALATCGTAGRAMWRPHEECGGVRRITVRQVDTQPVICAFEASGRARRAVGAAGGFGFALRAPLGVIPVFAPGARPA